MLTNKEQNHTKNFICEKCDFKCSKKSNYEKHLITRKHNLLTNLTKKEQKMPKYKCEICSKEYKSREGLWYHKKKCIENNEEENISNKDDKIDILIKENMDFKTIILDLVKNNGDLQKQMLDVCKNSNNTINTINNSHSNNKTFNMQVFLNEKCKDAMNIMEFVDSFTMQLSDLEDVGKLGYVEGISNIIIKKLNEMDVYKRPVHCSDTKRETLFVKDNNIWEKEGSGCDTLRRAIKYISKKNSDLLPAWSEENPASQNIYSKRNDDYIKMVLQSMGGSGDIETNENKIIRRISKAVMINKHDF
jgi:hypothetical protein